MVFKKSMIFAGLAAAALLILSANTSADKNPQDKIQFFNNEVKADTNLHFTGKYCDECHENRPEKGEMQCSGPTGILLICADAMNILHPLIHILWT